MARENTLTWVLFEFTDIWMRKHVLSLKVSTIQANNSQKLKLLGNYVVLLVKMRNMLKEKSTCSYLVRFISSCSWLISLVCLHLRSAKLREQLAAFLQTSAPPDTKGTIIQKSTAKDDLKCGFFDKVTLEIKVYVTVSHPEPIKYYVDVDLGNKITFPQTTRLLQGGFQTLL